MKPPCPRGISGTLKMRLPELSTIEWRNVLSEGSHKKPPLQAAARRVSGGVFTKNTTRMEMRKLKNGDKFVLGGVEYTASEDAHAFNGDGEFVVYDEAGDGWFESDFPILPDADGVSLLQLSLDAHLENGKFEAYLRDGCSAVGDVYNGLTAEEVGEKIVAKLKAYAEKYPA